MRVLCQIRPDFLDFPGAETTQLLGTRGHLERFGVDLEVSTDYEMDPSPFDLVHLYGTWSAAPTYVQFKNAKSWGRPVLLSPFYWNPLDHDEWRPVEERERLQAWWDVTNSLRREVLSEADLLAPATRTEADLIRRDFGLTPPVHLVPMGVDRLYQHGDARRFTARHGQTDFILCVGRIEPQKNQLGLIEALAGADLPLVFLGPPADPEYFVACQRRADNAVFYPPLPPLEVADACAAARVHALPSWDDALGQPSLAAGLAGCNVVTADRPFLREYLGDEAWYCDPADLGSIRAAVLAAWEAPRSGALRSRLLEYTWERAAIETLRAYEALLGSPPS
ncbi:MAG: glycosyltransferase [Bacillota bacterium]|nr:glycosyltransferase [Bacillota bacterium]